MPAREGTALHYETPEGLKGWRADARFYRVDPPLRGWDDDTFYEYIIVSAVDTSVFGGPEAYIFPADEFGAALDMMELPGSQRGTLSHEDVLNDLGYEVIEAQTITGESEWELDERARRAFLAISNKPHDSNPSVGPQT